MNYSETTMKPSAEGMSIAEVHDLTSEAISLLGDRLELLTQRLSPVLTPCDDDDSMSVDPSREPRCEMASVRLDQFRRLTSIERAMSSILNRLDL